MMIPKTIRVYGDTDFRGKCHKEGVEQASFFSRIRREFPDTYGAVAVHPRNEGLVRAGQFQAISKHRLEGMTKGASDILIPGSPTFVCEVKRRDHTQSKWQEGQVEYLQAAQSLGCFVCVALGAQAAWEAFEEWARV